MSNPMKYIKALEAVGFKRSQAEAQVQIVLDAVEGELVTKSDFALFREQMDNRFAHVEQRFEQRLLETEFKLLTRLGFLTVSTVSIAVAVLTWLIKN
jgi:hypothetical protein